MNFTVARQQGKGGLMYLGIDIGTSAVKSLVADEAQAVLASASSPLSISRPKELWSEQNPQDWWRAVEDTVAALRQQLGQRWSAIRAIGLSGQMHGAVLLDGQGLPLRPAIIWNDGRSHAEARHLQERLPGIGHLAGVPPMPGFAAPKLQWLHRHEPDVMARAAHLLLPKDYVRFRLTGGFATDMSDASGGLLLDTGKRRWATSIIEACGIKRDLLPDLMEGSSIAGHLSAGLAAAWGLEPGIPVAAGAGDAAAGAIGIGAIGEGDAFISLGTSALYFITRDSYRPAPEHLIHTLCHGLPGSWFQMAALLNGGSCLAWASELLGEPDIGKLLGLAEQRYAGPSPLLFLPYLTGERTPHNDPHAKGVLFGLTPATSREDMVQAILEGVAFSLADCQTYLAETGPLPATIGVIGGGSKSRFWMRLLASILGRSVALYEGGDSGPAFGAARLARLAATGEAAADVCHKPPVAEEIAPDPALHAAYQPRLKAFQSLYQALRPLF